MIKSILNLIFDGIYIYFMYHLYKKYISPFVDQFVNKIRSKK